MENSKFYWIKLRTDFFENDIIDWLQEQRNGCEYIVLYLKLCLLSANSGGILDRRIGEMIIPYDERKIAEITSFSIDTVIVALKVFMQCGLIYQDRNGSLYLPDVAKMVGSESASYDAIRQRNCRQNKKKRKLIEIASSKSSESIEKAKNIMLPEEVCESIYSKDFEDFWKEYPRKKNKGYAYKNFKTRIKQGWKAEQLIKAAKVYSDEVEAEGTEEKYIKHASTFLSDKEPFRDYLTKENEEEVDLMTYKDLMEKG